MAVKVDWEALAKLEDYLYNVKSAIVKTIPLKLIEKEATRVAREAARRAGLPEPKLIEAKEALGVYEFVFKLGRYELTLQYALEEPEVDEKGVKLSITLYDYVIG